MIKRIILKIRIMLLENSIDACVAECVYLNSLQEELFMICMFDEGASKRLVKIINARDELKEKKVNCILKIMELEI